MTKTIPQRELRNDNARVLDAIAGGEDFIVTRNGQPIAELKPLRTARKRLVTRSELAALAAKGSHIDREQFRADLDRVADQEL